MHDSKNTHPDNKWWGDGWGWSWFDAGNPTKTTSTDFKSNCLGCHVPAQATEWIYVNGYPSLKGQPIIAECWTIKRKSQQNVGGVSR